MAKETRVAKRCSIYDPVSNTVSLATIRMVPAQRDSLAQRSILLNPERHRVMKVVQGILRLDHENNVQMRNQAISGMDEALSDLSESVFSVKNEYEKVRKWVQSFDNRTLHMLLEKYDNGNHVGIIYRLNRFDDSEETLLRETLSYEKCLQGDHREIKRYLMDARFALGIEDLSELTGHKRRDAETLISLSIALHREVFAAFTRLVVGTDSYLRFAANPIAGVAFENPSRIDEIARYVGDRKIYPSEVDCGHLREWLDTPSKALGSGVL